MTITELIKRGTQYELITFSEYLATKEPYVVVATHMLSEVKEVLKNGYEFQQYERLFHIELKQSEIVEFLDFHLNFFEHQTREKIKEAKYELNSFKRQCKEIKSKLERNNEY